MLACIPVVIVHELGHALAMRLMGVRPIRLTATVSGFSMDYEGILSGWEECVAAVSGPAFGLLFTLACSILGKVFDNESMLLCAGLGLVLNLFNLLPSLPLDGGRALQGLLSQSQSGGRIVKLVSALTIAALIAVGLISIRTGDGAAILVAGIWLLVMWIDGT